MREVEDAEEEHYRAEWGRVDRYEAGEPQGRQGVKLQKYEVDRV